MTNQSTSLLVGLLAGITSALLLVSAGNPSGLSLLLYAAAAMPVMIAGLGWSNIAGSVAVVSAMAVLGLALGPQAMLPAALLTLVPAAWMSSLANLGRPAEELGGPKDAVAWFPLADILTQLCLMVAIALIVIGYVVGYGPEMMAPVVDAFVTSIREQNPDYAPSPEGIAQMKQQVLSILPVVQGMFGVLILLGAFYFSSAIVARSGQAKRPRDHYPSFLRMNRYGAFGLAAGVALSFIHGPISYAGWAIAGAFGGGFVISGFAILHARTMGQSWRGLALAAAYTSVLAIFPLFIILFVGLADTARTAPVTRNTPKS